MQTTQTLSEGLKREFKVSLPAADLEAMLHTELDTLKDRVKINGFRPGKVPMGHLRKLYGRSVMADVVQNAVNDANRRILEEHKLKLALEPQVVLPQDKDEVERIMDAKADLNFTVALEVLPAVELKDMSGIALTREVAEVADAEVDEAIETMAKQNRSYAPKAKGKAEDGDQLTVDFVGTIAGEKFEGGSAEGIKLVLGSGQFIPGFEEQLLGVKKGDEKTVNVTFPANYAADNLAGKDAAFAVTVQEIEAPGETKIDDELAKSFGLEGLDALKSAIKEQIGRDYAARSRQRVKKNLLDALDKIYDFPLPPTLVEQEFGGIWAALENDMKSRNATFESEGKTEDELRSEYLEIAKRRVRLGLVMAEIGEKAEVKVSDEELSQGLMERARQFPGQEKAVWDYYRKNPNALAEIRAPIFEEKVVDHLLSQAKVEDKTVSKDVLFADEDGEDAGDSKKGGKAKAKAKPKAKKTDDKAEDGEGADA